MREGENRRGFLAVSGAGLLLVACRNAEDAPSATSLNVVSTASPNTAPTAATDKQPAGEDVSAVEDLMREHGVIRRVLVAYREAAARLSKNPGAVPPDPIQRGAKLIRTFAEDYHEKELEEAHIFPAFSKSTGSLIATVNTLGAQHKRGREITDAILAATRRRIDTQTAQALVRMLDAFSRMYEAHAAIEDTIVFPAWKKLLTPTELSEMGDRFESIEHKFFGKDGFDDAVQQVGGIEKSLGIELTALTAPPPA